MNLEEKVMSEMKEAMRNKDEAMLRGLRAIKSAILLAKTEPGASKDLSDEEEIRLLQKLVKQRRDSLEIYEKENRPDLAAKEREEIEVISKFLPQQLSADELRMALKKIMDEAGVKSVQEMGKVMALANKQLAGKADGKTISAMVKELLANG